MTRASYYTEPCPVCRADVPQGGLARTSHYRKHVREGRMVETGDCSSGFHFYRVYHISELGAVGARRLGQDTCILKPDLYHKNIKVAAATIRRQYERPDGLISPECDRWIYRTQYASGTTVWEHLGTGEVRTVPGLAEEPI